MNDLLLQSREIYKRAEIEFDPYAVVLMFSGGTDSLTALYVAKTLEIPIDFILHINTRTGISETTEFVRKTCIASGIEYLEADAGNNYEEYILRKGFFGVGIQAHAYAYHLLKREIYSKCLSHWIRKGTRNRRIILLNGGRRKESLNRMQTMKEATKLDSVTKSNLWVNIINEWDKVDCMDFLHDQNVKINPVSALLHRSGECMCGTMQKLEERQEAAFWFPDWGKWLDDLEAKVIQKFPWKWGEQPSREIVLSAKIKRETEFQPLCVNCHNKNRLLFQGEI